MMQAALPAEKPTKIHRAKTEKSPKVERVEPATPAPAVGAPEAAKKLFDHMAESYCPTELVVALRLVEMGVLPTIANIWKAATKAEREQRITEDPWGRRIALRVARKAAQTVAAV